MKIKNNSCSDIDLSKINLNCCDDEIVFIQEAAPIQSHFLDASIYLMQSRIREKMINRIGVDYGFYNPYVQVELIINSKEIKS
jgi:hypothetical protein